MLYFRKYLTNSQKSFFGLKMMKVAIASENFKGSGILVLQWQRYKFSNIQKMLKFQFFPFTLSQAELLYFQKVFNEFSKNFFSA